MERQVALVTGGTRGLGRAIAERLLEDGYDVAVCGRRLPETPVSVGGREAVAFAADVRDAAAAQALIAQVVDRFGGLSLLVNNAGGSPEADLATSSASLIEKVIALNLLAPLYLCRAAHAALVSAGGSVVNIASISGRRAAPGTVAYGAAKAGLLNATQGLAMEWAPDVRVNVVVVGLVENPEQAEHYGGAAGIARISAMVPMQRMARGSDVAGAVAWLASPQAAYITGAAIEVHGGGEVPAFLALSRSEA
ncbi:SDR family oxidoreductase [Sphingosinithalassobacter portus]|uniref:SDR family oxidoreductase n=1 Tax=Stakelama portus TaxID=2676234 RepID=UPI001EFCC346|nr:SDR family oxidoreductase [Sphingosinithalassobacter portus]